MNSEEQDSILIRAEGLKKCFTNGRSPVKAVDDVSFCIERGKTMGLVGESGSGKSTTGRLILRLIKPDSGRVYLGGQEIDDKSIRRYRRRMQIIFQDPAGSLDPYLRVRDIIAEGMRAEGMYTSRIREREVVDELLEQVGLTGGDAMRYPGEFSGGQQQRIGIARALAVHPEFLVCDEAVSALDVSYQAQIINMLMDMQAERGLSYLFISHDISVVSHISDTIGVMYAGGLVETGRCEEVMIHHAHPYTETLLAAVPIADPRQARARTRIESWGTESTGVDGCAFAGRCRYAQKICREIRPELKQIAPGHMCACHKVGS